MKRTLVPIDIKTTKTGGKLIENKTAQACQKNTDFFDGLQEIIYNIYETFREIFDIFALKEHSSNRKIRLQEAEKVQLNKLYRKMKGQLKELIRYIRPFLQFKPNVHYLDNYPSALENISDTLEFTIRLFNKNIGTVPIENKSIVDGQLSAFLWLMQGLNTGFKIYNQTEIGKQRPLDYFDIPEFQFLDFDIDNTNINTTITNFKKYMDDFIEEVIKNMILLNKKK